MQRKTTAGLYSIPAVVSYNPSVSSLISFADSPDRLESSPISPATTAFLFAFRYKSWYALSQTSYASSYFASINGLTFLILCFFTIL